VSAGTTVVIPGQAEGLSLDPMATTSFQFVMLALVASIHVLNTALGQ